MLYKNWKICGFWKYDLYKKSVVKIKSINQVEVVNILLKVKQIKN